MSYKETAQAIFEAVGGASNIQSATHCITRLRLGLVDDTQVVDEEVKAIPGVIGVTRKNGQYQIILGNDVANYYREFKQLGSFQSEAVSSSQKGKVVEQIIEYIASSMTPLIPALLGGGMIKVLVIILPMLGVLPADSQTIAFLSFFGDAPYYFMPLFLAYSASQKLKVTPTLAMAVGGILLHPQFVEMVALGDPLAFLGVPVTPASYASSVIPILIMVWLMSYIEAIFNKIVPAITKSFLQPTLVLLVSGLIALVVVGPIGVIVGEGLSFLIEQMYGVAGWLTLAILGAIMPFVVMTGMHWAFAPIFLAASIATPDMLILPAMLGSNLAQGAASMAVGFKSKKSATKQVAFAAGFSALFAGISEPALYGVTLKYKKPLYAAMIGGGAAGLFIGLAGVKSYLFAVPSLISLPQFIYDGQPSNFINALIAAGIALSVTFILAYLFGIDEELEEKDKTSLPSGMTKTKKILSPLSGQAISLQKVDDATFSEKMLGEGMAIRPSDGRVYSPFEGVVTSIFPTKHAIGLTSSDGIEVLIHLGIDTVELKGEGFKCHVSEGDTVTAKQLLIEMNLQTITQKGYDPTTPVVVTNTANFLDILPLEEEQEVVAGDELIYVL